MKVLQICNKPPFPPVDGGAIAMGAMTRAMAHNGYDITVLNMVSWKHKSSDSDFPDALRKKTALLFAPVDLRLKPVNAFFNLFSNRSYHAERFYSAQFAAQLKSLLEKNSFDIIHVESIFPFVYFDLMRQLSQAKIIVRLHNIEHEVWETASRAENNPLKKWYLQLLAKRLKIFEETMLEKADGIITISGNDLVWLQRLHLHCPLVNIPLGVDLQKYPFSPFETEKQPVLFHLGAMDWIPNQQGMEWFLDSAWKTLSEKYPGLRFFIAGRKMPERFFKRSNAQLIVEGTVESPVDYMQSKDIMVAPLLSGSGIRVKIIEGMALGKAVVTTSVGAAGIDCANGENILIADTPDAFVQKISACLDTPALIKKLGSNARQLVEKKFTLAATAQALHEFYGRLQR